MKKIDAHKIKHKLNVEIFIWDLAKPIKRKSIKNYKAQLKTNQILKDEMRKKNQ
jgi:hypothetical protein